MARLKEGQHQKPYKGTNNFNNKTFKNFDRVDNSEKYFFILGNGPSINDFLEEHLDVLGAKNVITIGTNVIERIYTPHYVAVLGRISYKHVRKVTDPDKVTAILPEFKDCIKEAKDIYGDNYITFPTKSSRRGGFGIDKKGMIECPSRTVGVFALNCGIVMGGKKFVLVGFDGKAKHDKRPTHFYANRNTRPREIDHNVEECFVEISKYLESVGGWLKIVGFSKYDKWFHENWRIE